MDSGSGDRRVPEAGPIAEQGRGKADSGPVADDESTWLDADGQLRWTLRVNFYRFDENDDEFYCGAVIERGGRLVANPVDDPCLQRVLSQPLQIDGQSIFPADTERFLTNLHLCYTARDFAASKLHRQHPEIDLEDGGISDWNKPSFADYWQQQRELAEYLARTESEEDDSAEPHGSLTFKLSPIPDWMRKGPRPKSRQRELFGDS